MNLLCSDTLQIIKERESSHGLHVQDFYLSGQLL